MCLGCWEGRTHRFGGSFASRLRAGFGLAKHSSTGSALLYLAFRAPFKHHIHVYCAAGGTKRSSCPRGAPTLRSPVTPGRADRGYGRRLRREVRVQQGAAAPALGGAGGKARWRAGLRPGADGGRAFQVEETPKQCSEDRDRVCVAASSLPEKGWVGGPEGRRSGP